MCIRGCHSEHVQMWPFVPPAALHVTGAVSETGVPCLCCPEDEWIYTYLVRYPHIGSPAFQPWGVKIDMAFPKELEMLWLCPCPLSPVLVSSKCQPWCPSVLFIYLCMETAVVWCGVWCCLLFSLPTDCCSKGHSANLLIITFLHQLFL